MLQANLVLQNLALFLTLCSVFACQMQNKRMVTMILSLFHMCINWFLGKNYQVFWHYVGTICLGTSSLLMFNTRLLSCTLAMDIKSFLAMSIYNGINSYITQDLSYICLQQFLEDCLHDVWLLFPRCLKTFWHYPQGPVLNQRKLDDKNQDSKKPRLADRLTR